MRPIFSAFAVLAMTACAIVPQQESGAKVAAISGYQHVSPNQAVNNFVQVVRDVEPVAEAICRARAPRLNCDFEIVVDADPRAPINAYQTADETGRPILAFTAPLIITAHNRDELAFIMAHEAAHHILGHIARQNQSAQAGAILFGGLASILSGGQSETVRVGQQIGASIGARSYSKSFELEADALGTQITSRAGYNPLIGAQFFARIPDPGDRFLGTHPANADRLRTVEQIAASL